MFIYFILENTNDLFLKKIPIIFYSFKLKQIYKKILLPI